MACGLQRPSRGLSSSLSTVLHLPSVGIALSWFQVELSGDAGLRGLWISSFVNNRPYVPVLLRRPLQSLWCVYHSLLFPTRRRIFYFSLSDFQPQAFSTSGSPCKHFPNWFSLTITPVPRNSQEPSRNLSLSPKVHLVPFKDSPHFLLFSERASRPVSELSRLPPRVVMSPGFVSYIGGAGEGRLPTSACVVGLPQWLIGKTFPSLAGPVAVPALSPICSPFIMSYLWPEIPASETRPVCDERDLDPWSLGSVHCRSGCLGGNYFHPSGFLLLLELLG